MSVSDDRRTMGLWGATGVGVGAIVGGGILALAGVAFAQAGPAGAILAFAINGVLAYITAMSFAEVSSKFPESGGAYIFAKKLLSVEAAFIVGWVVWFASITAAALYAIGFAAFAMLAIGPFLGPTAEHVSTGGRVPSILLAAAATLAYTISLSRRAGGGGLWANIAKVVVFGALILGGVIVAAREPWSRHVDDLSPGFPFGMLGVLQAMGFTFIALQGFGLIASVASEIHEPARTIPRAMFLSLAIALAIYMPLLFLVATVGVPAGANIVDLSRDSAEAVVAIAAGEFLGRFGYWLVVVAGLFSMLTALQVNILAAAHVARAMAKDRSLPNFLSRSSARAGTPTAALWFTAFIILGVVILVPNVQSAGAAASLIFLVSFALVHWIAILLRRRSVLKPPPFRTPWFPAIPLIGGLGCLALAVFQGFAAPDAGAVAAVWMGIGGLLFIILFSARARLVDATHAALDPEVIQLRGGSSLVLVPISNPNHAEGLVTVAQALAPPQAGRVLLLNVVRPAADWGGEQAPEVLQNAQHVLGKSLQAAAASGVYPETLITVAADPWHEIVHVAHAHRCESVLLGVKEIDADHAHPMDALLDTLGSNLVVLRAPSGWNPSQIRRVLVPLAGRGGHDVLLARLLGSFSRSGAREVTFLRVLPEAASEKRLRRARRRLGQVAADIFHEHATIEVVADASPVDVVARHAESHDLVIVGVQGRPGERHLFGRFTAEIARRSDCAMLLISYHG